MTYDRTYYATPFHSICQNPEPTCHIGWEPILVKNGQVVADIPDERGVYDTAIGPIGVDYSTHGQLILSGEALKGKLGRDTESGSRIIYMDQKKLVGAVHLRDGERLDVMMHGYTSEDENHMWRNRKSYPWNYPDSPSRHQKYLEKSKASRLEWVIRRNKEG